MRHQHILTKDDSLLVVIDFQEKLLAAFENPEATVRNCIQLIKFANIMEIPIIWTEQYPKGLGPTVSEIKAEMPGLSPIEKLDFSCFGEPAFANAICRHGRKQLIMCGIETHICVEQTVLDGIECGFQPHIVTDACASRKKRDHKAGLRKMEGAGAVPSCVEMAMYEILGRSDAKEFREVLKLVK